MKANFELTEDVEKLVNFLTGHDRATYSEMSAITGRHVDGKDRYVLTSARRVLENQHGTIFATERGIGLVKASNGQVATLSTTYPISKIKRVTRKAEKRQARVNVQELDADERLAFAIGRVVLNAVGKSTLKSFRNQIAKEIEQRDGELIAVNQVLSLPRHRGKK